jgi:Signal transduction histidine kinase
MAMSLLQNRPIRGMEAVVERPDGIRVPVLPYPTPLRDAAGTLVGGVNMLVEITDRKQAEKQLRQLAADSERLVTERTHELLCSQERLRALASDLTLTEQRERRRLATELHDYLAQLVVASRLRVSQAIPRIQDPVISASLTNVDQMLDQALTYTRSLVAELSPHILYRFGLAKSLVWLGDQMKQHALHVVVTPGSDSFTLPDDQAVLLFQSVRELLFNVVKHSGTDQASITINVDECNELWICVEDNGIGFDVTALSRSQDSHSKFGLLSIRERMELLGGECEVSSSPGAGTLAILRLPLSQSVMGPVAAPHPLNADVPTTASGASGRSVRVLLVDDHAMVRQGLRSILDSYDDLNVVGEAADGQDAVIMSRSLHPDVVIMDVNLPLLDGIEATRIMCREHESITIIGISVRNDPQVKLAMTEAGAAAFLPKESAASQLYEVILNHCPVKS